MVHFRSLTVDHHDIIHWTGTVHMYHKLELTCILNLNIQVNGAYGDFIQKTSNGNQRIDPYHSVNTHMSPKNIVPKCMALFTPEPQLRMLFIWMQCKQLVAGGWKIRYQWGMYCRDNMNEAWILATGKIAELAITAMQLLQSICFAH